LQASGGIIEMQSVSTLAKIQAAAESLPLEQQEELYRSLGARLHPAPSPIRRARLVREGADTLLAAPSDATPMTAENVKRMLDVNFVPGCKQAINKRNILNSHQYMLV